MGMSVVFFIRPTSELNFAKRAFLLFCLEIALIIRRKITYILIFCLFHKIETKSKNLHQIKFQFEINEMHINLFNTYEIGILCGNKSINTWHFGKFIVQFI